MPLDLSIYRGVTPQVQQPDSPLDIMQKVATLRDSSALAQDRRVLVQERQAKLQQEAADRAEQAQMQAIVQQNGGDMEKSYPQLAAINAEKADKYLNAHLGTVKLQNELGDYDTMKKASVAEYVTKNLQGVQNQHDYDVARAQIQSARALLKLPPATEQEMPAVYDPTRVAQMIQNGQMTQDVLGKQQKGTVAFYTLPNDPTPHAMKVTPDGQVIWQGQDVREQAQPWEKAAKESATKLGSFEDYVTRTYGENPTPAQILAARKAYGQADDRPRVSVSVAGGGGGGLDKDGLELAGTMTRLLGRIPVGMARSGNPSAIMNEAAKQTKLLGQTPVGMMQKAAMYQSDKKALDQMTKMASAAYAYENKAQAQLDIVDSLSDKVWRTKSPLINRAILAGQTEIAGDKDATLLLNAITTASTEYAKIMMGGTASAAAITDSAQKEAQKLLSAGMSKGTLKGATALMRTEMGLTNKGYDAAIAHINEGLGGQPQAPAQAAPNAPPVNPKDPMGLR